MKSIRPYLFMLFIALTIFGCKNHDLYDEGNTTPPDPEIKPVANTFDFSTTQSVSLNIDYSVCKAGAVWFSVYADYPFTDDVDPVIKTDIDPIYEDFTNLSGVFNETVTLPAYAEHLYVYTGNFFVKDQLMECDVLNGSAKVTAKNTRAATRGAIAKTRGDGDNLTNSLETLYQLSYIVDWRTGDKTDTKIYKDWVTPLGQWDANTGRPAYLMTSDDTNYSKMAFTDAEMSGIIQTISNTLTNKKTCNTRYRQPYDLVLDKKSEVSVTVVGGNTCWNSTMGYFYYAEGQTPTKPEDLNIIMLFPNTQDGQSTFIEGKTGSGDKYNGNIALHPGDMVQLMYYPNIASGDLSGATTEFPKGTRIGFILKSNGWGMQKTVGDKKYHNIYTGEIKNATVARQYNSWAASANGLSYSTDDPDQNKADNGIYKIPNPTGQARTAKFAYQNAEGKQYAIVSFEDACNDDDYDDFILALKPVGVFEPLPTPEEKETKTTGVYAFEDLWPAKGDYDMNDAVVDYSQVWTSRTPDTNVESKIYKESVNLTTYQNYVTLKSGLAVNIKNKVAPTSVKMKTIKGAEIKEVEFEKENETDGSITYLLTDNITGTLGTQFVIEFEYSGGITNPQRSSVKVFIFRKEDGGLRWEVHKTKEAPTSKMNYSYFGTEDDLSEPANNIYYVREGNYPFAFFLSGVTIEPFKNTILLRDNEKKPISDLYPGFLDWATNNGSKDWYKK
jgi:LruC domain-containing protein